MPLLLGAFTSLFQIILSIFGKRFALAITVGASFVAGWVAVQAAVVAAWAAVGYILPDKMAELMPFLKALLPPNLVACFAAWIAVRIVVWLWRVQSDWLRMVMAAKA